MKGTEGDCGWGRVQKEGLAKTGVKRLADFSGWAESGDDTDRVEKEDVTSEVVETRIEQRERERDVYYRKSVFSEQGSVVLQRSVLFSNCHSPCSLFP